MIGWFLEVPGRAHFLGFFDWLVVKGPDSAQVYCILGYTMPLIAAVQVLVTWDKGLSLLFSIVILIFSITPYTMFYYYESYYWDSYCSTGVL